MSDLPGLFLFWVVWIVKGNCARLNAAATDARAKALAGARVRRLV